MNKPPVTANQALQAALQHHQAGRFPAAEALYAQVLAEQPDQPDALHFLGLLYHQQGRHAIAVDLMQRALALNPSAAPAHNNLGNAFQDQGRLTDAIDCYHRALALKPDYALAHNNLGKALRNQGRPEEAIASYQQALGFKPDFADAHFNLGLTWQDQGRLGDAIDCYQHALALKPDFAEAHCNLGNALRDQGRLDEALACYRRALAIAPDLAVAHCNQGDAMRAQGRLDEALACYQRALTIAPDLAVAHCNLGTALKDEGRLDEAIASVRRALVLKPDYALAHSNLLYTLAFHPGYDAGAIAAEHRRWNDQHAAPLRQLDQVHHNDRNPERRLRIGYVSPDFREHCQSQFTVPLLSAHDHQQFEVFAYADVTRPDAMTGQLQGYADHWRTIVGKSDAQVTELIREDRIDILVDLTMHMARNRLLVFARKPAPVQVTWLAYPGSTGVEAIDYRLSDPYLDPPGSDESIYAEQTIRLPDSFWCYDPLDGRHVPVSALPAQAQGSVTFGCLNNFCKINAGVLALWAQVLQQVAGSRLLLLAPEGSARPRTEALLARHGVEPARVEFVGRQPRARYMELYHRIDLGLDSFPYNGHTTSLDSFWMGVPVVTLVGQTVVARAGWCQLSNLGLPELAADTPEAYVRIAVALALDLPRLQQLRSGLRERLAQSPLMDAPKFAGNLESAYRQMWRTWCATTMSAK